jgi:Snf7.
VKFDISTLTKEDIDIINLMASINKLTDRKQELMAKITDLKMQISTIDNKNTLKHLLKLKFLVNKSLDLTLNSLNQLNTVMIKIDDSNMNLDVYHQVLSSTKILKSLNGRLDVDEIEEINFDLKTEIDKVDEITNVLIGDVDDSEIDEEYEKLVKETEKKEKESKKADEKKTDESKQTSDKIEQDNEKEESKHVIEDSKNEFVANKDLIDRLQNLNIESTEVKEEDPVLEPAQ